MAVCCYMQSGDTAAVKEFGKRAMKLKEAMDKFTQPPSTLKEYSGWLASFQASQHDQLLEIPGHTTCRQTDTPHTHPATHLIHPLTHTYKR